MFQNVIHVFTVLAENVTLKHLLKQNKPLANHMQSPR